MRGREASALGAWLAALAAVVALLTAGCSASKSPFARQAGDAGEEFAAAAITLRDLHEGRLTRAYAQSSFVNFEKAVGDVPEQLPKASGHPDPGALQHLLDLYRPASRAVAEPCLDAGCDWQGQVAALEAASKAFIEAGGG